MIFKVERLHFEAAARSRVNDTVASLTACTGSLGAMTTNVGLNLIVGRPARGGA
jgi:hypothetical protein